MRRPLGLLLLLLTLCGCTSQVSTPVAPNGSSSAAPPPSAFVRSCDSSVSGSFSGAWRKDSVVAGPATFADAKPYASIKSKFLEAPTGVGTLQKMLAVIRGSQPVTVSLLDPSPDARLAYDPDGWGSGGRPPMTTGQVAVRFEPCADRASTQFNGAFLVRGPQCVAIEVTADGAAPIPATISFGAGSC